MTIDELIALLERYKKEYGNLPVIVSIDFDGFITKLTDNNIRVESIVDYVDSDIKQIKALNIHYQ